VQELFDATHDLPVGEFGLSTVQVSKSTQATTWHGLVDGAHLGRAGALVNQARCLGAGGHPKFVPRSVSNRVGCVNQGPQTDGRQVFRRHP